MKFINPAEKIIRTPLDLDNTKLHKKVNQDPLEIERAYLEFQLKTYSLSWDMKKEDDHLHDLHAEANSRGYRSPEFYEGAELITLGCSQTFGMGVCYDYIWPVVLAKKLGFSLANIAYPGWPIQSAIREFYAYVNLYGKPKAVSILLPEFFRYVYVPVPGVSVLDRNDTAFYRGGNGSPTLSRGSLLRDGVWEASDLPLMSKRPHYMNEILTPDFTYYQGLDDLYKLLIFCEQLDIAVSIGSWEDQTLEVLRSLGTINRQIIQYWDEEVPVEECSKSEHVSIIDSLIHDEFERGTDRGEHMGVHHHLHHAEQAEKILKKQLTN